MNKELMEKLKGLDDAAVKKVLAVVEHQRKSEDLRAVEYEALKEKVALREIPFRSSTEAGEMVANLDNFQYLMQNTRLTSVETNALHNYMTLVKGGVYPDIGFDQIYMALKISEAGKGRGEKVSIVTGSKEKKDGTSFFAKLFKNRKMEVEESGGD